MRAGPIHRRKWMLHFVGGHVTLEGLEFELDAVLPDEPVAAIRGEDTELILRGCSFRRTKFERPRRAGRGGGPGSHGSAARTHTGPIAHRHSTPIPAISTGDRSAVMAEGPADIVLRDCTMGPARPSIWFDNARSAVPVPVDLRLIHSSILAGDGPVFRFDGGLVRAWVEDSVIAPAGRSPTTLVMIDEPRNLIWRGRSNLFSQIGTYLVSLGKEQQRPSITSFAGWEQSATEPREVGSRLSGPSVWDAADPLQALSQEQENPTRRLPLEFQVRGDFGFRGTSRAVRFDPQERQAGPAIRQ